MNYDLNNIPEWEMRRYKNDDYYRRCYGTNCYNACQKLYEEPNVSSKSTVRHFEKNVRAEVDY